MRPNEYVVGLLEAIGILAVSYIPEAEIWPFLVLICVKFIYFEQLWVIPGNLLSVQTGVKVAFGAMLKFVILGLTIYLSSQDGIILLVAQPAYLAINLLVSVVKKNRDLDELVLTGLLLYVSAIVGLCLQFSYKAGLICVVWSCVKKFEANYSLTCEKLNCKYSGYSWSLACAMGLSYTAGVILISGQSPTLTLNSSLIYLVSTCFIFIIPNKFGFNYENKIQTSYLVVYLIAIAAGKPIMLISYIIISKTSVFLLASQTQEVLPTNSRPGVISHILSHKDSRRIFLFLIVNFLFMFVEALYGYWSNSLGLISDAIHMCFDCTALAIGLYASYISKHPPDAEHPYGYTRYETLSGFINSIFLIFVGVKIFIESIERIMETPEIQTDMLILVSVLGLIVNMFGLCSFHDLSHGDNNNLKGVFLHVLADTLGSVGVIISSVLIKMYDLHISDPISSLVISTLILLSVTELLGSSVSIMMESDSHKKSKKLSKKILKIPGVEKVENVFYWKISGKADAAMACLKLKEGFQHSEVSTSVRSLLPPMSTVQIT